MTSHTSEHSDSDITTPDGLESMICETLSSAMANGVDPRGSIVCRTEDGYADLEVTVSELAESR